MITVFTPTYNRATLLEKCHESLCKQETKDFEWIIVDDESTDDTRDRVISWMISADKDKSEVIKGKSSRGDFDITLISQHHGGKHRATNKAAERARGELFVVLDSDDQLLPHALHHITKLYATIADNPLFGGVAAQKGHFDGTVFGPDNIRGIEDLSFLERKYGKGKKGDKCEVFKTEIIRAFPQPDIEGEDFCPESLVWNRISTQYKLRYSEKIVYLCEYLPGGLTANSTLRRMNNPKATLMTYSELLRYDIPFFTKCRAAINFHRFKPCLGKKRKWVGTDQGKPIQEPCIGWGWYLLWPLGIMMSWRDKKKVKSY